MKTIFQTLTAVIFALLTVSCSSSSDDDLIPAPSTGVKPQKIVRTYSNNPTVSEVTYTYDGNKLKEINISPQYDVSKVKFTYTGDNITKIESFIGTNFTPYGSTTLEYTGDLLTKAGSTDYTYNANGIVEAKASGIVTKRYTVVAGNITNEESIYSGNSNTMVYTYDTKNNIHRNITGLNKVFNLEGMVWDLIQVNTNNRTNVTGQNGNTTNKSWTYDYNADNYPTKMIEVNGNVTTTRVITY